MAQPITIVGTITDSSGISKQVTITGIGSVVVDPGYGVGTPMPPHPAHPIYTPPVFPSHPIVLPPVFPAHPIAPGGPPPTATPPIYYPPEIWPRPPAAPPVDPGYGIPGPPYPPHPAHPIAPGGPPPTATPPIYYPPEVWPNPPDPPEQPPVMPPGAILPPGWSWYYTNIWGWVLVWRPTGGGGKPQPPSGDRPTVTPH